MPKFRPGDIVTYVTRFGVGTHKTVRGYRAEGQVQYDTGGWDHESDLVLVYRPGKSPFDQLVRDYIDAELGNA